VFRKNLGLTLFLRQVCHAPSPMHSLRMRMGEGRIRDESRSPTYGTRSNWMSNDLITRSEPESKPYDSQPFTRCLTEALNDFAVAPGSVLRWLGLRLLDTGLEDSAHPDPHTARRHKLDKIIPQLYPQ
jgi:hypothetical protein